MCMNEFYKKFAFLLHFFPGFVPSGGQEPQNLAEITRWAYRMVDSALAACSVVYKADAPALAALATRRGEHYLLQK